eukprot:1854046-Alexandrium_andersonii.AAC.1
MRIVLATLGCLSLAARAHDLILACEVPTRGFDLRSLARCSRISSSRVVLLAATPFAISFALGVGAVAHSSALRVVSTE